MKSAKNFDAEHAEKKLFKFIYDLETEDRLVRVGLKKTSQSLKVFEKHKDLFTIANLQKIRKALQNIRNPEQKEILERIYFTIAGSYVGLRLAKLQDRISTYYSQAKVKINDESIYYFQIAPIISKEEIFEKREGLEKAARPVVAKINPAQLRVLKKEIALIKSLGYPSYLNFLTKSKKVDYAKFYSIVLKIKKDTDNLWTKTMDRMSKTIFKRPFEDINSTHVSYLRSVSMFDTYFPKEKVVLTFKKFVDDLGMADLLPAIKIDDVDRPRKNPRAVCYWPDPPKEVHLVIKPIGGEQDFEAMLHEGGHALHAASESAKLPYTFRALSRSHALTEAYAFILEDLVFDPVWLSKYLNLSAQIGLKIQKQAFFVNLLLLRRYLGKYMYEYEMFKSGRLSAGSVLYSRRLTEATGFKYNSAYWLADMDSGLYSADYLRAWIGAAQIKDYLIGKFGKEWFFNKKAGIFLRRLWSGGVTNDLEDVVEKLGYEPFDIVYLVDSYNKFI